MQLEILKIYLDILYKCSSSSAQSFPGCSALGSPVQPHPTHFPTPLGWAQTPCADGVFSFSQEEKAAQETQGIRVLQGETDSNTLIGIKPLQHPVTASSEQSSILSCKYPQQLRALTASSTGASQRLAEPAALSAALLLRRAKLGEVRLRIENQQPEPQGAGYCCVFA